MKLNRNPEAVSKHFVVNEAGQLSCKAPCKIHSPVRFEERGLTFIGVRTYVFGIFPLILENGDYVVFNICGRVEIAPESVKMITIDEKDYYEFSFNAGDVVIKSQDVVQDDKIIYFIVDELYFQSKVPWYMKDRSDVATALDSARHYADSRAAELLEVPELFTSITARLNSDEAEFARHHPSSLKDKSDDNIRFVPLASVHSSVTGTINRIAGNYFEPAVESEIATPSKKVDNIETVLRA